MSAVIAHDWHHDTIVRSVTGKEKLGFLLARSGPVMAPLWWAHYADGEIEQINPANGFPRPDPDPAVRSKNVALPPTIQTGDGLFISHGSRYTGLMRRAVQCQFSRGMETKFSYKWNKTHGIIEYPRARVVASTPGYEQELVRLRRQWVVEISAAGVFVAPLAIGVDCRRCAVDISNYMALGDAELSLAWAFVNKNEGGAVQRLMTAAEIAPAYAAGPWYQGMGWAFSKSGWAASNVTVRNVYDGDAIGLPDYYETRLVDLAFTVAFPGTSLTLLTSNAGVATAFMAGHGFANGALVSISGAEQDEYNGAHVVNNVTDDSFQFFVPSGIPSPATGTLTAANAAGTGVFTAALTVGATGKVTFRPNDLGTLWVPGEEQITRWTGVRPYFNIINGADGPVHVFYDGEEKITTRWSFSSSTIPLDQRIDQNLPDIAFTGTSAPLSAELRAYYEAATWNGVTGEYHFWGDDYAYTEPIAQNINVGFDGHPCALRYRPTRVGSGHSYSSYANLHWGFTGPFSLSVDAYSRRRMTSRTEFNGDHERTPQYDYIRGDRYYVCSEGAHDTANLCIAEYHSEWYRRFLTKTREDRSETASGCSSLVLLPQEREAVLGVKLVRTTFTNSSQITRGVYKSKIAETGHSVATPGHPACAFTNFSIDWNGFPTTYLNEPPIRTSGVSNSMSYALRASGGLSISGNVTNGATPDLDAFIVYQVGVKESADSSFLFMKGGLKYADPQLSPPDQTGNSVYILDGVVSLSGGFAPFPSGRTPVAFIGQV